MKKIKNVKKKKRKKMREKKRRRRIEEKTREVDEIFSEQKET